MSNPLHTIESLSENIYEACERGFLGFLMCGPIGFAAASATYYFSPRSRKNVITLLLGIPASLAIASFNLSHGATTTVQFLGVEWSPAFEEILRTIS